MTPISRLPYVPRVSSRLLVSLRGMRFHARVGILPHERELPQPLDVDISVRVAPSSLLDYRELYRIVQEVVEPGPLDYLERIAGAIADSALSSPEVLWVRVVVRKPNVSLPGPLGAAEIELERDRTPAAAGAAPAQHG